MIFGSVLRFLFALFIGFLPAAAQAEDTLKELLATQHCSLSAKLRAVYERPSVFKQRDRFLVISIAAESAKAMSNACSPRTAQNSFARLRRDITGYER